MGLTCIPFIEHISMLLTYMEVVIMNNTVETNQTINMNGVVNMEMYKSMKKAELREVLKGYGLEISNNEFKATKHEELVGRGFK